MFKIYSKGCEYAIKALTSLKAEDVGNTFSVKQLCRLSRVPEAFTRKAFQLLTQKKILKATPGPGGGYRFTRHPKDISLLEIIHTVEGAECFSHCILGMPACNDAMPCPIHGIWAEMKQGIVAELEVKTLFDLIKLNEGKRKARG